MIYTTSCLEALSSMKGSRMAYSAVATSDYSDYAMSVDPMAFSADLGNFDMCMRSPDTHHCLAGSVHKGVKNVYLAAFSGICVPIACGERELADQRLLPFIDSQINAIVQKCAVPTASHSSSHSSTDNSCLLSVEYQQEFNYFTKLKNVVNTAYNGRWGYTCGAHNAWMTPDRWLFMTALGALLLVVLGATVYQMIRDNTLSGGSGNVNGNGNGYMKVNGNGSARGGSSSPQRLPRTRGAAIMDTVVDAFSLIRNVPYVFATTADPPSSNIAAAACASNIGISPSSGAVYGAIGAPSTPPLPPPSPSSPPSPPSPPSPERFHFLDGMRTMSMLWIILGHTLTTNVMNGIANPAVLLPPGGMLATFPAQLFMTSRFAVDTFFFISGFLVSISLLRRLLPKQGWANPNPNPNLGEGVLCASNATTTNNDGEIVTAAVMPTAHAPLPLSVWLPSFYLHRLLRILPPYAFCLLLWWKVGVLLGSGPFWIKWNQFAHRCDLYAWTNLLFINNLHPYSSTEVDQCFYVGWYLANDMQFYIISPLFVLAFVKSKRLGVLLTAAVVLVSCLYTYQWTMETGASAHSFDGVNVGVYSQLAYSKPQFRFPSYGIGLLCGMLRMWQNISLGSTWKLPIAWAGGAMALSVATLFFLAAPASWSAYRNRPCSFQEETGPSCGSGWSVSWLAVYNSCSKPLWALALSVITLLCSSGNGYFLSRFLGHTVWRPPAKLSFGVYLLHVTVLNLYVLSKTQKLRYSHFDFAFTFLAVVFMSFMLALFVAVFIEGPACRISRQIEAAVSAWYSGSGGGRGKEVEIKQAQQRFGAAESTRLVV